MTGNDIKLRNELNILGILYRTECSRVELSSRLNLSKASVSCIVAELIAKGIVSEKERGESKETGGKKPIILSVNKSDFHIISVHFDIRDCWIAITDIGCNILSSDHFSLEGITDVYETLDFIVARIQKLVATSSINRSRIIACGISAKGLVNFEDGVILYTAAKKLWRDVPVKKYLEKLLDVDVFVENDSSCLIFNDINFNSVENESILSVMNIEDGIGSAIADGHTLLRGAYTGITNFGHSVLKYDGPVCSCGRQGCFEALCSVDSIVRDCREIKNNPQYGKADLISDLEAGDEDIDRHMTDVIAHWLGVGIANFVQIFNPAMLKIYLDKRIYREKYLDIARNIMRRDVNAVAGNTDLEFIQISYEQHIRAASAMVVSTWLSARYFEKINARVGV